MKVLVIGGSGHIGTYLIPKLIKAGHHVINMSRNQRKPYKVDPAWNDVEHIQADRVALEADGRFGQHVSSLRPDVIIDLICFSAESAKQLAEAVEGQIQHFISCGTVWVHGPSVQVPLTEDQPRHPFGEYGIHKAQMEAYLLDKSRRDGFPATVLHPGHIVGPGWVPLNPAGHFNPNVFVRLARGEEVSLANFGMETVHHVHAEDVAQGFEKAMNHWSDAVGESFHVVSPAAVTLRGYAEEVASWFGRAANLRFLSWDEWKSTVSMEEAGATLDHISHSPSCSIAKAVRKLDYNPRYSSFQAVRESVHWLIENHVMDIGMNRSL